MKLTGWDTSIEHRANRAISPPMLWARTVTSAPAPWNIATVSSRSASLSAAFSFDYRQS